MLFTVVLILAGNQVPKIPLGDVVFNNGAKEPEHKDKVVVKLATILGLVTVTVVVKLVAHCPGLGVKT